MAGYEMQEQTASLEFHINPLVNWLWMGFGILAIGTLIALLPETAFSFATATMPAGTVTTSLVLLSLLLAPAGLRAQEQARGVVPRSELQRALEDRIMCQCGCHQPMGSCQMRPNCGHYDEQAAQVKAYIAEGKSYDEVLDAFIAEYQSQAILAAPLDRGFNRLAWAVPYTIGVIGLVTAGFVAVRWSRRRRDDAPVTDVTRPEDAPLASRLEDELRDLD
jgi:cytochrome c-type biogenesis protein CcmF